MMHRPGQEYHAEIAEPERPIEITATPGEVARQQLGLPEDVRGRTIVDLCAGGSSLATLLASQGATVYAVDTCYRLSGPELTSELLRSCEATAARSPKMYYVHVWNAIHRAICAFVDSYEGGSSAVQYVAADVRKLTGMEDGIADYVVSLNGITQFADTDSDSFQAAMQEAARITKPDGHIILVSPSVDERLRAQHTEAQRPLVERLELTLAIGRPYVENQVRVKVPGLPTHGPIDRATFRKYGPDDASLAAEEPTI